MKHAERDQHCFEVCTEVGMQSRSEIELLKLVIEVRINYTGPPVKVPLVEL